jgi:tRNA U55 pseudouridine synthase TruB
VAAWTYIRTIADDLWSILWTGWYISELRRIKVWKLDTALFTELSDLKWDDFLHIETVFPGRVFEFQDEVVYKRLQDWQRIAGEYDFPKDTHIFLSDSWVVRYIVEYTDGVLHPRKRVT